MSGTLILLKNIVLIWKDSVKAKTGDSLADEICGQI